MPMNIILQVAFLAVSALAGERQNYCMPKETIAPSVEYCFQNKKFVDSAEKCLTKFDGEVLGQSQKLGGDFQKIAGESVSAQEAKLQNSGEDLTNTDKSLKGLLGTAFKARQEISNYLASLIYAGNPPLAYLVRFGLLAEHQQDPCYRENYRALQAQLAKLDKKISELRQTDAKTEHLFKTNYTNKSHLGAGMDSPQRWPASRAAIAGSGSPKAQAGVKHPQVASTITGNIKKVDLK